MKIIILSLLCSMTTLAQAADAKDEVCGNAFFWDELKARALCDIGTSPAGCLHLNALGSVVLGAGAYKMGLAGANAVDSARAIKMFKDIEKLRLVETSSELRRHRSQMKGIDENLPEETRKKS